VVFTIKLFARTLCLLLAVLSAQSILTQSLQAQTLPAQEFQARAEKIRLALASGNSRTALDELISLKTTDTRAFELNNYDYLLARLFEAAADRAAATSTYQSVVTRRSLLTQYALWHLAQIARSTGDLVQEREQLRQLLNTVPTSLLRDAATIRLAESFSESADYAAVVATLRPLVEAKPGDAKKITLARRALTLSGEAYLRAGKRPEARELFIRLLTQIPDNSRPDDFALAAARGLDALDKTEPATAVSETEHLQRAAVYQFNRDFEGAAAHYLAVVANAHSSGAPDALYQLGRGFYQRDRFDDALKFLRRVIDDYSASSSARDAQALLAATYSRQKRTDEAVTAYKQFIDRFPAAPNPERPYLNIIDILRDAGRDEEAQSWIKQIRAHFPNQIAGTLALFALAKIHLAQNSWSAALTDLEELRQAPDLGGARIAGGTTAAEVAFLRAFVLGQLGRTQDAIDAYLAIAEGRNEYYGYRADEGLRALSQDPKLHSLVESKAQALTSEAKQQLESGGNEAARRAAQTALRLSTDTAARSQLLNLIRRTYAASAAYRFPTFQLLPLGRQQTIHSPPAPKGEPVPSHQALADELFFLGLDDEAVPELAAARIGSAGNPDLDYTTAIHSLRGDIPYPAVRFAEQTWKSIPSDYLVELAPRQMAEMLYPAPYRDSLLKHSGPRKLDPRLVLAIARQETRFQADAKSVAAARGLMQFISATSSDVARQLGRRDFQQDELYNPDTAIEFGAHYLSTLFQQFPNQPQAVAAAYNGGADNVARWVVRSHTQDPDRYVPEIGFAQSKDYVYRVLSNFWVYQKLYTETLQPAPQNGNQ
jgi:soluble lytic murein transglycosylase